MVNISEFSKPKESPSIGKLPELTINNETTTVVIKSKDQKVSVELHSNHAKEISFKATDITNKNRFRRIKNKNNK